MVTPKLDELIEMAREKVAAMTPGEKQAMLDEQARSWARGEAGMGTDADEARERAYLREHGRLPDKR